MTIGLNWTSLRTPYGSAERIPSLITRLGHCTEDGGCEREIALFELRSALVKDGVWPTAAPPTTELLLADEPDALTPSYHLILLANILSGGCERQWMAFDPTHLDSVQKQCMALVASHTEMMRRRLQDDCTDNRAAAALLLMSVPTLAVQSVPWLESQYAQEESGRGRASILVALDFLDQGEKWRARVDTIAETGDSDPLLWGAAVVCWLRRHSARPLADVAMGLAAWLELDWREACLLPWRDWTEKWTTAGVIHRLVAHRGDNPMALVGLIQRIARRGSWRRAVDEASSLLGARMNNPRVAEVVESVELTPAQREVAEALADLPAFSKPTWMPACGPNRRRWLGLSPTGPLERPVRIRLGKKEVILPAWKAWHELENQPSPKLKASMPKQLWTAFSPLDRWQAFIEYRTGAYCPHVVISEADVRKVVADVPVDETTVRIAEDLGATLRNCRRTTCYREWWTSRLLLLPFVQARAPLPESLLDLYVLLDDPVERSILASVPRHHLIARLDQELASGERDTVSQLETASSVLAAIEFAPDRHLCDRLVRLIEIGNDDDLRTDLAKAAKRVSELRAAQARWRASATGVV